MTTPKWTEERTEQLINAVADINGEVPLDTVAQLAEDLNTTARSISSKLRKLGYEVETVTHIKAFSDDEEVELRNFVEANPNVYTYAEIAQQVCGGKFTNRQVQGKMLAMELSSLAAPAPKVERAKTYSDEEESTFAQLASEGASIEAIASALDKTIASVRGKALSMLNQGAIDSIPHQESKAGPKVDALEGVDVENLTVAQIAESTGRTERGIKTMLTRRAINCADYKGAAKAAKRAEKAAA